MELLQHPTGKRIRIAPWYLDIWLGIAGVKSKFFNTSRGAAPCLTSYLLTVICYLGTKSWDIMLEC